MQKNFWSTHAGRVPHFNSGRKKNSEDVRGSGPGASMRGGESERVEGGGGDRKDPKT